MGEKYNNIIKWIFEKIPSYQNIGIEALRNKLENIIFICNELGNPQDKIKTIHIAGTNGKGSTSHLIGSALQENKYKVGIFCSPHLKDFRERIKINGIEISKKEVIDFIEKYKYIFEKIDCSFFEMTTAMAFYFFSKKEVDFAIIETGLGGRLDSTNIINPIISIITNISLDHTNILGDNVEKIAKEKAGIIKKNVPIIIGEKDDLTKNIFIKIAKEKKTDLYFSEDFNFTENLSSDLKGIYQKKNILTSFSAINILKQHYNISLEKVYLGFNNVIKNTNFRGRWEILNNNPKIVCDIAHNFSGIKEICLQLKNENYKNLYIVYGTSNDKDLNEILNILPKKAKYFLCEANTSRAMKIDLLENKFLENKFIYEKYNSVLEAYNKAKNILEKNDLLIITGSNFVVSEIL